MFAFFEGASLKIARNLIKVTGLRESLAVIQKNTFSSIGEGDVLKLLLAMDACNLTQTMREDFIKGEIPEEDLQDTLEDYLVENLKAQTLLPCRDGAERMEQCQEILGMAAKFQEYWAKEEFKDPGPRFYCVKELLGRLGSEANTPIHDNLFEFVYEQHNRFIRYFRTLLEPLSDEKITGSADEPAPLAVSLHNPAHETPPDGPGPLAQEVITPEEAAVTPEARVDSGPFPNPPPEGPGGEVLGRGEAPPEENLLRTESLSPPADVPVELKDPGPSRPESFRGGTPEAFSKPMPQMLEELFQRVNPIDPGFSGLVPPPETLPQSPEPLTEEGIAMEALKETPPAREDSTPPVPPPQGGPRGEPGREVGIVPPDEDFLNLKPKG